MVKMHYWVFQIWEKSQIAAKKRLAKGYSALIAVYNECITKATELLKV